MAIVCGAAALAAAPFAGARVVDNYCSPSGDFCTSVEKQDETIKLRIATFSFRGDFDLCVKPDRSEKECREFGLHERGDLYARSVNWARKFEPGPGRFSATWHVGGKRIGPPLHFHG